MEQVLPKIRNVRTSCTNDWMLLNYFMRKINESCFILVIDRHAKVNPVLFEINFINKRTGRDIDQCKQAICNNTVTKTS